MEEELIAFGFNIIDLSPLDHLHFLLRFSKGEDLYSNR